MKVVYFGMFGTITEDLSLDFPYAAWPSGGRYVLDFETLVSAMAYLRRCSIVGRIVRFPN